MPKADILSVGVLLRDVRGLRCCRKRVGERRSLSIGFGAMQFHGDERLVDPFYGEWEFGTYYGAWRISRGPRVLCGSQDVVDSTQELHDRVERIELGCIVGVEMLTEFDVRVVLDGDLRIDFLGTHGESTEHVIHIFGPNDLYADYSIERGWVVRSN